jgi:hypothetical protein
VDILRKLQNLSEPRRKRILWSVVIVIGAALFVLWLKNIQEKVKNFQGGGFNFSSLKEKIGEMPEVEIPEINEEDLKKSEESQ